MYGEMFERVREWESKLKPQIVGLHIKFHLYKYIIKISWGVWVHFGITLQPSPHKIHCVRRHSYRGVMPNRNDFNMRHRTTHTHTAKIHFLFSWEEKYVFACTTSTIINLQHPNAQRLKLHRVLLLIKWNVFTFAHTHIDHCFCYNITKYGQGNKHDQNEIFES